MTTKGTQETGYLFFTKNQELMPTNGKRNREAGHQYEKDEAEAHRRYFPHIITSRAGNRFRDSQGIDLCHKDEQSVGRLFLDISCKSTTKHLSYTQLIEDMGSEGIPVILHRKTSKGWNRKKKCPGTKFITRGEYMTTTRAGYEVFLQHIYAIQKLRQLNPALIEDLEKELGFKLLDVVKQITP